MWGQTLDKNAISSIRVGFSPTAHPLCASFKLLYMLINSRFVVTINAQRSLKSKHYPRSDSLCYVSKYRHSLTKLVINLL